VVRVGDSGDIAARGQTNQGTIIYPGIQSSRGHVKTGCRTLNGDGVAHQEAVTGSLGDSNSSAICTGGYHVGINETSCSLQQNAVIVITHAVVVANTAPFIADYYSCSVE